MDREHLTRLIDDPARAQRDDIADLKAMAERYPWFSGAHLLLAVGGHREGDVLFDEQLRASAAHLPSRAVLFDRLHAPLPVLPTSVAPPPAQGLVIVPEPETAQHEGSVRYAAAESAEDIPVEVAAPPVPEPPMPVVQEIPAEPSKAIPPEPSMERTEDRTAVPGSPGPSEPPLPEHIPTPWKERLLRGDRDEEELDRQMRDSAVAISYELLLEREGSLRSSAQENAPLLSPTAAVPSPPPLPPVPMVPEPPKPAPVLTRSFSDWLAEETSSATAKAPARAPMARPVEQPEIIRAVQQLPPIEPKHTPETAETKALVERFLQQNTQAQQSPKKTEFFNPQTAAKRSLEEHADLVTETLARIYEKQGNIAKAIAAYERLAVKHPEKSAHFRALAKALAGR